MVHSAVDTVAITASWVGLKLADRPPTKRFPFGLHRAETLASLLVSAVIFVAGIDLLAEGFSGLVRGGPALLAIAAVSYAGWCATSLNVRYALILLAVLAPFAASLVELALKRTNFAPPLAARTRK